MNQFNWKEKKNIYTYLIFVERSIKEKRTKTDIVGGMDGNEIEK